MGRHGGTPVWDAKSWDATVGRQSWDAKSWDATVGRQKSVAIKKNSPHNTTKVGTSPDCIKKNFRHTTKKL